MPKGIASGIFISIPNHFLGGFFTTFHPRIKYSKSICNVFAKGVIGSQILIKPCLLTEVIRRQSLMTSWPPNTLDSDMIMLWICYDNPYDNCLLSVVDIVCWSIWTTQINSTCSCEYYSVDLQSNDPLDYVSLYCPPCYIIYLLHMHTHTPYRAWCYYSET